MSQKLQKRRNAGTALVETALTLGLYVAIVFSLFDFGYIMYLHQTIAWRVESAARYGALNPTDTAGMQNYVLYLSTSGSGPALFGLTLSNVSATRTGSGTNDDRVVVTVSGYRFPAIYPAMSGQGSRSRRACPSRITEERLRLWGSLRRLTACSVRPNSRSRPGPAAIPSAPGISSSPRCAPGVPSE